MPALGDCEELSLQHWPATECKTEQVWSAKAEQISQLKNQMQLEPGGVFSYIFVSFSLPHFFCLIFVHFYKGVALVRTGSKCESRRSRREEGREILLRIKHISVFLFL